MQCCFGWRPREISAALDLGPDAFGTPLVQEFTTCPKLGFRTYLGEQIQISGQCHWLKKRKPITRSSCLRMHNVKVPAIIHQDKAVEVRWCPNQFEGNARPGKARWSLGPAVHEQTNIILEHRVRLIKQTHLTFPGLK